MAKDMGTDMGNPLAIRQVDGKWKDGQSDRRTDRQTDGQTGIQTNYPVIYSYVLLYKKAC